MVTENESRLENGSRVEIRFESEMFYSLDSSFPITLFDGKVREGLEGDIVSVLGLRGEIAGSDEKGYNIKVGEKRIFEVLYGYASSIEKM